MSTLEEQSELGASSAGGRFPEVSGTDLAREFSTRIAGWLSPEDWEARAPAIFTELDRRPYLSHMDFLAGRTLLEAGQSEPAVLFLRKAAAAEPQSADYQGTLVQALVKAGQVEEAARLAVSVFKAGPDRFETNALLFDAFGSDLFWVQYQDATDIAALIARAYEKFPEFNLRVDRLHLSSTIAGVADEAGMPASSTILAAALIIDNTNQVCALRLVQTLAALDLHNEMLSLIDRYDWLGEEYVHVLRDLFSSLSKRGFSSVAAEVLGRLAGKVNFNAMPAVVDMGHELTSIIYPDKSPDPNIVDPLFTVFSVVSNRKLVERERWNANGLSTAGAGGNRDRFRRIAMATRGVVDAHRASIVRRAAPAKAWESVKTWNPYLSLANFFAQWPDFVLPGSAFNSQYATLNRETGRLSGASKKGEVFAFGPYIELLPGAYRVDVHGMADQPVEVSIEIGYYEDGVFRLLVKEMVKFEGAKDTPTLIVSLYLRADRKIIGCEMITKLHNSGVNFSLDHVHVIRDLAS